MRKINSGLSFVIRILVIIALLAVGLIIYQTCSGSPLVQRIDNSKPDIQAAPFEVATVTRNYLSQQAVNNPDGSVTMTNWYENNGKKWVYHQESFKLLPVLHPRILSR